MVYKIMSTVKARLNQSGQIVSPTQNLLQENRLLQESELIPESIRKKIIDANVVVDRNSIRKDEICRGDIYVETSDKLSLVEQRQLTNGMQQISKNLGIPAMVPVIIRNAPDEMPEPASVDAIYEYVRIDDTHSELKTAFVGAKVTLDFGFTDDVKSTHMKSETIAKALNKELNAMGLRTVFADTSVCAETEPTVVRNGYMLFQKTARFNPESFSRTAFRQSITDALQSRFGDSIRVTDVEFLPVGGHSALIGSLSMENTQMAGNRLYDVLSQAKDKTEMILLFKACEQNPLFANGVGGKGISYCQLAQEHNLDVNANMLTSPIFATSVPKSISKEFQSSTRQDLSTGWCEANAFAVNLFGDKNGFNQLYANSKDVVLLLNELGGYDEDKPLITDIHFGTKVNAGGTIGQCVMLLYDDSVLNGADKNSIEQTTVENLKEALLEIAEFKVSGDQATPLMMDAKMCSPAKKLSVVYNKQAEQTDVTLKSDMIQSDFEQIKEQPSL